MGNRSSDCIAQCYVLYGSYVRSIIKRFYTDKDDIEDIFHDVFLKLLNVGFSADPHSYKTKNYIGKATRHCCISHMRKKIARQKNCKEVYTSTLCDSDIVVDICNKNIEDTIIEGMVVSTLYDVIHELEYHEQNLVFDKYFHNKKYVQLAAEQGVPYYSVKRKIKEINIKIKQKLMNKGIV
ncbi:MAG: sigma-70 family RNA polymerase sigma factor [Spirochaetes bacterium]|nr:sigma-70 family RNA polymerase sigma factor [Spirochaetota bacterium]